MNASKLSSISNLKSIQAGFSWLLTLFQIFSLVRDEENPQMFRIEYVKGAIRTYTSTERDSLLASVLDGVRASGNRDVCVKMCLTDRGKRLGKALYRIPP